MLTARRPRENMSHEHHTSELTNPCLRSVKLKLDGKLQGRCTSALYSGLLFHEVATRLHRLPDGLDLSLPQLTLTVAESSTAVMLGVQNENRPVSDAVNANRGDLVAEVIAWAIGYCNRFREFFRTCKIIGTELPCRMTIDVDGEPAEFASHLDLLFRDQHGNLRLWDWKTGEDSPTFAYLSRNMQFGMYDQVLKSGSVKIGDDWVEFGEPATLFWVQVRDLMPYSKKTTVGDTTYVKGDLRPDTAILRPIQIANDQAVLDEFALRVRMSRADIWPANPDKIGCSLCESQRWCQTFTDTNGGSSDSF